MSTENSLSQGRGIYGSKQWVRCSPSFESDIINPDLKVSPWSGHRRFAYDLISFMRPNLIVEIGTHYGCSFFTFWQAAKDLNIQLTCIAEDT